MLSVFEIERTLLSRSQRSCRLLFVQRLQFSVCVAAYAAIHRPATVVKVVRSIAFLTASHLRFQSWRLINDYEFLFAEHPNRLNAFIPIH